ncbi:aminoacyl-tRNA deacylase [Fructobacillus sp. M1-13]|uniref:Cys-tRNA(Pro)/Cys-tRNA(Cys) deacylase n=1 Tax=Fructobacillus papyriferae TaxID=2713171 RepID=A0ABS5QRC9_9LACO|nr:aminoacyl-tRNA deacylase [Fructobacillus papyriferae]MBS9335482.1 aminoacyl-tRNA deacylase [Fructobacillus papyriferae]MCD2159252.1 aminoacyl-tRNA deacylase [Fructobacillus papyriferae]
MAKKKKDKKTLPEQVLDKHGVAYESLAINALELTEEEKKARFSELGIQESDIYKTLAAKGDKTGPVVAVVPLTERLDMKKLAAVSGNKKVHMLPMKDLEKTTGYVHGANNPVGIWQNKHFPIFLDKHAEDADFFLVSAGELGHSDKLNPKDLGKMIGASFEDLTEETS